MTRINSKAKGANGEREFCEWLSRNLNIHGAERNLEQTRSGGADIIEAPFAFEIKRCETLLPMKWWLQVSKAVLSGPAEGLEPVVAYRQNRGDWEFLISACHIGGENGYIHVNSVVFKQWALRFMEARNGL